MQRGAIATAATPRAFENWNRGDIDAVADHWEGRLPPSAISGGQTPVNRR